MLEWAKRGRAGGGKGPSMYWVYQQKWRRHAGLFLPPRPDDAPWMKWGIRRAEYRIWAKKRDPLELVAGLKWIVDLLVDEEYLWDDSHNELLHVPSPTSPDVVQRVDRGNRGVTLEIFKCLKRRDP